MAPGLDTDASLSRVGENPIQAAFLLRTLKTKSSVGAKILRSVVKRRLDAATRRVAVELHSARDQLRNPRVSRSTG